MVKIPTFQEWQQQQGGQGGITPVQNNSLNDPEQTKFQQMVRSAPTAKQANAIIDQWNNTHNFKLFEQKPLGEEEKLLQQNEIKKKAAKAPLEGLIRVMDELKTGTQEVDIKKFSAGKLGTDSALQRFEQKKLLAGQFLAKMVENGRLSDKDREFYQEQIMNLSPLGFQQPKEEAIDSLKRDIMNLSGYNPDELGMKEQPQKQSTTAPQIQDLMDILGGISKTPELAAKVSPPGALISALQGNSLEQGQIGRQMLGGIANEYNQALGEPLKGGNFLGRAAERAVNKPFSTILDILPFLKFGKAGSTGKAIQTGEAVAESVPSLGKQLASKMYANLFEISKNKGTRGLNPQQIGQKMADYGISANSMDELSKISQTVTGDKGIINLTKREAIGRMGDVPVAIEDAYGSILEKAKQIPGISKTGAERVANSAFQTGVKSGKKLGTTNALDAFSVEKNLESLASDYYREWLQTKSVVSKKYYEAYKAGADEIRTILDEQTKKFGIEDLKTPEAIQTLQEISPKLAKEFIEAKTVSDLRKLEAPFVGIGRAVEETGLNVGRTMSNVGTQIGSRMGGAIAGSAVGGPLGGALGYIAGPTIEPLVAAGTNALRVPLTTKVASGLSKIKSGGNAIQSILQKASIGGKTIDVANLMRLLGINSNQ